MHVDEEDCTNTHGDEIVVQIRRYDASSGMYVAGAYMTTSQWHIRLESGVTAEVFNRVLGSIAMEW